MSVMVIIAAEFAIIAAFAHGVADPYAALTALSAANCRTFEAQYGEAAEPVTVAEIAASDTDGSNIEEAARALSHVAYNCVTNNGTDCRTDAERDAFNELARAVLCEQSIANVSGRGFDLLRGWEIPDAPAAPVAPRAVVANDVAAERPAYISRDEAIARIRAALRARTGRVWSVSHDRGTASGWITVHAPPRRRVGEFGYMSDEDRATLAAIFGEHAAGHQGVSIAPDSRGWNVAVCETRA